MSITSICCAKVTTCSPAAFSLMLSNFLSPQALALYSLPTRLQVLRWWLLEGLQSWIWLPTASLNLFEAWLPPVDDSACPRICYLPFKTSALWTCKAGVTLLSSTENAVFATLISCGSKRLICMHIIRCKAVLIVMRALIRDGSRVWISRKQRADTSICPCEFKALFTLPSDFLPKLVPGADELEGPAWLLLKPLLRRVERSSLRRFDRST